MPEDFKVRIGQFEGPLELLLELVEKRKLHISEVALSKVADEFIDYVRSFEEFPMAHSADFILVASTLLLIKSKSLLPGLPLSEEEEEGIEELGSRLATYQRYREIAAALGKMFGNFLYFAEERRRTEIIFAPTAEITPESLRHALSQALQNMPKLSEPLPQVSVEKVVSLEEMIERLSEKIEKNLRTSFSDFAGSRGSERGNRIDRVEIIVSFLAMLELVKQGAVRVSQISHFSDIEIESESVGIPSY